MDADVHLRRMAWESLQHAPPEVSLMDTLDSFAMGIGQGLEGRIGNDWEYVVLDTTLQRVVPVADRPEVCTTWQMVIAITDTGEHSTLRLQLWLIKEDGEWRIYDVAFPDTDPVRWSVGIGARLAASFAGDQRAVRRMEGKIDRYETALDHCLDGELTLAEIDPLVGDPDLEWAQPSIELMRLDAMIRTGRPDSVVDAWVRQVFARSDYLPRAHLLVADWMFARAREDEGQTHLFESAVDHYRVFIDRLGPDPQTSLDHGYAYTWLDDYERAREAWQEWIDVAGDRPGQCHLEAALYDAGLGRVESTLDLVELMLDEKAFLDRVPEILSTLYRECPPDDDDALISFLQDRRDGLPDGCRWVLPAAHAYRGRTDEAIAEYRLVALDTRDDEERKWCLHGLINAGDDGAQMALQVLDELATANNWPANKGWVYRGRALRTLDRMYDARRVYVDAIRDGVGDGPLSGEDLLTALQGLDSAGGFEEVLAVLADFPPDDVPAGAWQVRVRALRETGRGDEVADALRAAILDPRPGAASRRRALTILLYEDDGPQAVLAVLDRVERSADLELERAFSVRGAALERLQRLDDAMALYVEVVRDPSRPSEHRHHALRAAHALDRPQAVLDLLDSMARAGSEFRNDPIRAQCLERLGRTEEAVDQHYDIARDPDTGAWYREQSMRRMVELGAAERLLRLLEILHPDQRLSREPLVRALALAALDRTDEALTIWREQLDDPALQGDALQALLDVDGGPEVVVEFVESLPEDERAFRWESGCRALRRLGRHREALRVYDRIVADPEQQAWAVHEAHCERIVTHAELGDLAQAASLAEAPLREDADGYGPAERRTLLAAMQLAGGRDQQALATLQAVRDDRSVLSDLQRQAGADYRLWVRPLWTHPTIGAWLQEWCTEIRGVPFRVPSTD